MFCFRSPIERQISQNNHNLALIYSIGIDLISNVSAANKERERNKRQLDAQRIKGKELYS